MPLQIFTMNIADLGRMLQTSADPPKESAARPPGPLVKVGMRPRLDRDVFADDSQVFTGTHHQRARQGAR